MNKKILTVLAAGTVTLAGAGFAAHAADVDPWEAAANEYLAHNANQLKPAEEKPADKPAAEKPAAEKPAEKPAENKQVIDEKYVKDNIDTPTGAEEKAKEDKYLDKAEAKYKEELAKQSDKKDTDKKDNKAGDKGTKPAGKTLKTLPKTSAAR